MLVTDARTKIKPSGSGCLIENVALYFSFLFVLLSNNVTQLQWQPLAFQISTSFFVVWPIAGGGEIRAEIQSFLCPNSFFQEEQVR